VTPAKAVDTLSQAFAQLSARKWLKCSQLPKLRARPSQRQPLAPIEAPLEARRREFESHVGGPRLQA
jgi:hypothetical protein